MAHELAMCATIPPHSTHAPAYPTLGMRQLGSLFRCMLRRGCPPMLAAVASPEGVQPSAAPDRGVFTAVSAPCRSICADAGSGSPPYLRCSSLPSHIKAEPCGRAS